jgi:hypothetical protein
MNALTEHMPHNYSDEEGDLVGAILSRPFHAHYEALIHVVADHVGCSPHLLHATTAALDRRLALRSPIITVRPGTAGSLAAPRAHLRSRAGRPNESDERLDDLQAKSSEIDLESNTRRCQGCKRPLKNTKKRICGPPASCPFKIALDRLIEPEDSKIDIDRKRRLLQHEWTPELTTPSQHLAYHHELPTKRVPYSPQAATVAERILRVGASDGLVDPAVSDPWIHLEAFGYAEFCMLIILIIFDFSCSFDFLAQVRWQKCLLHSRSIPCNGENVLAEVYNPRGCCVGRVDASSQKFTFEKKRCWKSSFALSLHGACFWALS